MTNHVETLRDLRTYYAGKVAQKPSLLAALDAAIAALEAQQSEAVAWRVEWCHGGVLYFGHKPSQPGSEGCISVTPLYTSPTPAMRAVVEALRDVRRWAASKCPCKDETPDPCTLCGATVASGACRSVESIFPAALLAQLDAALAEVAKMLGDEK